MQFNHESAMPWTQSEVKKAVSMFGVGCSPVAPVTITLSEKGGGGDLV